MLDILSLLKDNQSFKRLEFRLNNEVETNVSASVINEANSMIDEEFPFLSLSLFREFFKNGNRKNFETPFFRKREMLSTLVIAETIENKGRFIDKIEEGIYSLLSEPSWTPPAHNLYIRDTEQLDTPDISRPVLDLFSCETGEILALTASLLENKLSQILVNNIHYELRERILKPYLNSHFWWMGGVNLNNWSPWCTQNVLISTLSLPTLNEDEKNQIINKALTTLDEYYSSYPTDGGCDEGASYYHAAALALFGCFDVLSRCFEFDTNKVFSDEKIKNMATFIEKVHVIDDIYLNFADCSPKAGHLGAREYLFAKAINNDEMKHHAAFDFVNYSFREADNNYNLYYKFLSSEYSKEIYTDAKKIKQFNKPRFIVFNNTELAIYREKGITFAIKGGHNDESHNHNDVGSFILYKGSTPLLIDIGVETYTKKTFSPLRYDLLPMQSVYHNVVNFPPLTQINGKEYKANNVYFDENNASLDLTKAYQEDERLKKYNRNIIFDRDNLKISFTETIESSLNAELSLMSVEKPKLINNSLIYPSFSISFLSSINARVEEFPVRDLRLRLAWPEMLYRTIISIQNNISWVINLD